MTKIESRAVTDRLSVTTMGLGGTGLGNMYRSTEPKDAHATVHAAFELAERGLVARRRA